MKIRSKAVMAWAAFLLAASAATPASEANWPSFRGSRATGWAEGFPLPEKWSLETGRGIKWKTPVPGLGHSSPVIWGRRVFVTSALTETDDAELKVGLYGDVTSVSEATKHRWVLFCLDKTSGRLLWQRTAHEGVPRMKRHPKSSHANATPATDGERVVCSFGAEGLYCYDLAGTLLWRRDLGSLDSGFFRVPSAQWGFGSSPVIHENRVIVQCDVQTNSFLAAFDLNDGQEVWRTPRADVPTWSTPTVDTEAGRSQIIVNGFRHIGGYDLRTGKERWKLSGGGDIPVPTPVVADDLIFITSAHGPAAPIYAIKAGALGQLAVPTAPSETNQIAWSLSRRGNYMQTPLVYRDFLYCCNDAGVLACYRAKTGENLYSERLGSGGSGFSASAVAGDGKLYLTSELGAVFVVKGGPQFEILARNELGETCLATPAISEGVLFFRTRRHLVAVAP